MPHAFRCLPRKMHSKEDQIETYHQEASLETVPPLGRDMVSSLAQMPGGAEGAVPLAEMRKKDGESVRTDG